MLLDETRCNRSTWSNLQMMQKETDQDDTVWKCKEFHKMQQSTNARKIYTTAMKDWRRILLQLYVLFCACLCFILCTSVCNVEYFLEVGVYLSQGRFQTTLQITKQLQWRRQNLSLHPMKNKKKRKDWKIKKEEGRRGCN